MKHYFLITYGKRLSQQTEEELVEAATEGGAQSSAELTLRSSQGPDIRSEDGWFIQSVSLRTKEQARLWKSQKKRDEKAAEKQKKIEGYL
jgi:hypothetical protein